MTFKGVVKNGVIILPEEVKLPDGLEVQVEIPDEFVPKEAWDDSEWERREKALRAITAIGRSSGDLVGRQKRECLAEVYGSARYKTLP